MRFWDGVYSVLGCRISTQPQSWLGRESASQIVPKHEVFVFQLSYGCADVVWR